MNRLPDWFLLQAKEKYWSIIDLNQNSQTFQTFDVVVIGSGAGGSIAAKELASQGMKVAILEAGGLYTSSQFDLNESNAYRNLYQDGAARQTADHGINILQGKAVGGSTLVNWTSSFRTPDTTLDWWKTELGLTSYSETELAPFFAEIENYLNIQPWQTAPNPNNQMLAKGCSVLGIPSKVIPRNVKGCWNLGYCDMGCPTNAKQSMLLTAIPDALNAHATLIYHAHATRLKLDQASKQVRAIEVQNRHGKSWEIKSKRFVLAAGSINTPKLMLDSQVPDPFQQIGKRTFLHPVVISGAIFPEKIIPYHGAPQSIYSDYFLQKWPLNEKVGYKLEVPPIHPVLFSSTLSGFGVPHRKMMLQMPYVQAILALMRDGFHPQSQGGVVRADGLLHYPITDILWESFYHAWQQMAEIQFAAGAKAVFPLHESAYLCKNMAEVKRLIPNLSPEILKARIVSAHVMGGAGMGRSPDWGCVDSSGQHWWLNNLYIADGSIFPTSIGANPQLSIYGMVLRNVRSWDSN